MNLTGATCLITGANRGMGAAFAKELAKRPDTRILAGVRDAEAYQPFGDAIRAVHVDLSSRESIEESVAKIVSVLRARGLLSPLAPPQATTNGHARRVRENIHAKSRPIARLPVNPPKP